jgi:hypothetical protein
MIPREKSVLCLARSYFESFAGRDVTAFEPDSLTVPSMLLEDCWLGDRRLPQTQAAFILPSELRDDPGWKQVVPCVLVRRGDKYLSYRRIPPGERSEPGHWSIVIEGAVEKADLPNLSDHPEDNFLVPALLAGVRAVRAQVGYRGGFCRPAGPIKGDPRKWAESDPLFKLIGYVNDETDPRTRGRFGLVYEARVGDEPLEFGSSLYSACFGDLEQISPTILEPWSRMVFEGYLAPQLQQRG